MLKTLIQRNLKYFNFFYLHLKSRALVLIILSSLIGLFDGLGIAFIIPLLQLAFNHDQLDPEINSYLELFFPNSPDLFDIFFIILVLFSAKGLIKFLDSYYRTIWQEKLIREIKLRSISLLRNLKYTSFIKLRVGKIQNTLTQEILKISLAYKFYFKTLNLINLVILYLLFSSIVDWKFTVMMVICGLIISSVFKFLYSNTKKLSKKIVEEAHTFNNLLSEKVRSYKYLKSTGLIDRYIDKLKSNTNSIEKLQKKLGVIEALISGFKEPILVICVLLIVFLQNKLFPSSFSIILLNLLFIYRAFIYFMASQENWNLFLTYSGSMENFSQMRYRLEQEQEEKMAGDFSIIDSLTSEIVLKQINYKYPDNKDNALHNISLSIYKNQTMAIVGQSGSGKTTLLNILSGLLQPNSGQIIIDGKEINKMRHVSYSKLIGYITQEPTIFNDTIFNNITFWDEKNKENLDRFYKAIQEANIGNFISSLSLKEDTLLDSNGVNLSGGQMQRISIARELYKNPSILLMDEATSSLDSKTEIEIQKNIEKLSENHTVIIIAHRLTTIKSADIIVLLEGGKIMCKGSYKELLDKSETFKRMVELQSL